MSEAATITPTAETNAAEIPAQIETKEAPVQTSTDSLSFFDAIDKGFEDFKTTDSKPEPTPEVESSKIEKSKTTAVNEKIKPTKLDSVDILTKRMTGQEEKVEEKVKAEDDLKAPENLKPEAQTAWARLTKDLRDARAKIKELETKTSEAPTNSVEQQDLKAQLDALKTEKDEYEQELRLARLESTKEYKQAVTEPLSVIQKEVSELAKLYETDPRNIYAAMTEPDPMKRRALLKEATEKFDPVDSLMIRNKAEELQKVFERRDILTKDVKTVLQMLEAEEKQEFETRQKQAQVELETAYKIEWENMQKENPLLRPIEDNEAWNNTLKAIEKQALDIENTELDARSKARLTFNAAAMPVVMNVFQDYVSKTQARIQELEKLTSELRATIPSSGSDTGSAPEVPADLSFVDALERGMAKR